MLNRSRAAAADHTVDPPVSPFVHVAGLDGLRGAAALVIVVFHLLLFVGPVETADDLPGGFLAVDAFFVLSGFLVTTLALEERRRRGTVRWLRFYERRAARILPALVPLGVAFAVYLKASSQSLTRGAISFLREMTATSNFGLPFDHRLNEELVYLWSVTIEMHFYVLAPLIVGGLLLVPRRVAVALCGAGVVAMVLWTRHLYLSGTSPLTLYIRTDTRGVGILVGIGLAFARGALLRIPARVVAPLAWLSLAACGWAVLQVPSGEPDLYSRGGFAVFSLLVAVVLVAVLADTGPAVLFRRRAIRAVGLVSYGLYLWHVLVFVSVARWASDLPAVPRMALALAIAAVATIASWNLVERPAMRWVRRLHPSPTPEADDASITPDPTPTAPA